MYSMTQRALAEALGTAALVLVGNFTLVLADLLGAISRPQGPAPRPP